MADENDRPTLSNEQVEALAIETGVTPKQIRQIVQLVGPNRPSIVFQARDLAKQKH